ncbi:MAG: hypothetical protein ACJA2W_001142 [Planctomycetota bacterium]|jgi:uncharacterized protein (DUF1800 family)
MSSPNPPHGAIQGLSGSVSRRQLLTSVSPAASSAAAATSGPLAPQAPAGSAQPTIDLDLVLAHHATQGFTVEVLEDIRTLGRAAWVDRQLQPGTIADPVSDAFVRDFASIPMSIGELQANYPGNGLDLAEELQQVCIGRSALSERQLHERVVEFWNDHFHINQLDTAKGRFFFTAYDRDIIRQKSFGNFEDLLISTAKSAAMLKYLNGDVNVVGAANENFAREVMELHTLGVDGPYTEMDVRELSRCFTGWRYQTPNQPTPGEFVFDAATHDFDAKVVLGSAIPAGGGVSDALSILHNLSLHPKTLDYVSRKLISWLAAYDPPQEAVDRVVARWQATGGDLREVVREALSDEVLTLCSAGAAAKLKRPFHFGIGLMRQLGAVTTDQFQGAGRIFSLVGQRPYVWGSPDGYPDTLAAWGADAYGRWNFSSMLLGGSLPGTTIPTSSLLALQGSTPPVRWARRFARILGGGLMVPEEVARVQAYVDASPPTVETLREAIALLASCPSYQFY